MQRTTKKKFDIIKIIINIILLVLMILKSILNGLLFQKKSR